MPDVGSAGAGDAMTTGAGPLLIEERDDRVVVVLNRPRVRNAIDLATVDALHEVCALLEAAPRPLLLTGSGDVFAAGADVAQLRDRRRAEALAGINRQVFDRVARLPLPTVAAVNGPAIGGGAELAYACDVRLATATATFSNPEPGLGIMAAAGAAYRLPALIGQSAAKAVLLAGHVLDAAAAVRLGLVMELTAADELIPRAHAVIDRMCRQSALALRLTKLVADSCAAGGSGGAQQVAGDLAQAVLFETADKHERMTAFLDRARR
jgi:enoyl-CoA hydratase/carnithine racemase